VRLKGASTEASIVCSETYKFPRVLFDEYDFDTKAISKNPSEASLDLQVLKRGKVRKGATEESGLRLDKRKGYENGSANANMSVCSS
jgi:hypothetical protein